MRQASGGFLRDTMRNAIGSVMMFVARFVALAVIARVLGVEQFGTVALAVLCLDLTVLLVLAGLPGVSSRFLPVLGGQDRRRFRAFLRRWLAGSVGILLLLPPLVGWAVLDLHGALLVLFTCWAIAVAVQTSALAEMQGALCFQLVLASMSMGALALLLGAGMVALIPTVETAFAALCAGHLAQVLPWLWVARREVVPRSSAPVPPTAEIIRYGTNTCIIAALTAIVWNRGELFVVEMRLGETTLGHYGAAVTLTAMVWRLTGLLQGAVTPHMARRLDTEHGVGPFLADMSRLTLAISGIAALGIALFGRELVLIVFGSAYAPAGEILAVMAPGIAMAGINTATLGVQMLSNGRVPRNALMLGAVLLLVLAWVLAGWLAADGAALARALTMCTVAASMPVWLIWRGSGPVGKRILGEVGFAIAMVGTGSAIALFAGFGLGARAGLWLLMAYAAMVRATGVWTPAAMLRETLGKLRAL